MVTADYGEWTAEWEPVARCTPSSTSTTTEETKTFEREVTREDGSTVTQDCWYTTRTTTTTISAECQVTVEAHVDELAGDCIERPE